MSNLIIMINSNIILGVQYPIKKPNNFRMNIRSIYFLKLQRKMVQMQKKYKSIELLIYNKAFEETAKMIFLNYMQGKIDNESTENSIGSRA